MPRLAVPARIRVLTWRDWIVEAAAARSDGCLVRHAIRILAPRFNAKRQQIALESLRESLSPEAEDSGTPRHLRGPLGEPRSRHCRDVPDGPPTPRSFAHSDRRSRSACPLSRQAWTGYRGGPPHGELEFAIWPLVVAGASPGALYRAVNNPYVNRYLISQRGALYIQPF